MGPVVLSPTAATLGYQQYWLHDNGGEAGGLLTSDSGMVSEERKVRSSTAVLCSSRQTALFTFPSSPMITSDMAATSSFCIKGGMRTLTAEGWPTSPEK
ncbi:hypothetical protein E5288_WYG002877 [Bos mutus]|uniref:Uncharacterized protein n=1 Tax=Bos mutus TaxID=72004 RepID=A0A6B0RSC8_9CETA|nr:hypothetical protein [Bos mutus]